MMYCVATGNWHHHSKYARHLQQLDFSKLVIQIKIRQHQGMIGDTFQKLHAIASRTHGIMQEVAHRQRPTSALEHSHYKWASP